MVNVDNYKTSDPFGYQSNPHDKFRLQMIRQILVHYGPFEDVLDLGAGEGWITKHIPAHKKYAFEVNAEARARISPFIHRYDPEVNSGSFSLVTAMGVMYDFYDWQPLYKLLIGSTHSESYVLITGVTGWHLPIWADGTFEKDSGLSKLKMISFGPYREYDSQTFYLFGPK